MTQEQIKGTELITDFMDFGDVGTHSKIYAVILEGRAMGYFRIENMLFHKSFVWITPIVQKIINIFHGSCHIPDEYLYLIDLTYAAPIDVVFDKVTDFLTWYNNQKEQLWKENK